MDASAPAAVTEHDSLGGVDTVLGAEVQDEGVGRAGSPEASPGPAAESNPGCVLHGSTSLGPLPLPIRTESYWIKVSPYVLT